MFESWHILPSTTSVRGVARVLIIASFVSRGQWCLPAANVTGMMGSSLASRIPWVVDSAATGGGWGWAEQGLHRHLCYAQCCKVHRLHHCVWRSRGPECERVSGWRNGVSGPTAAAAQLPVAAGTTVAGRPELCSLPPLLLCVLWGYGLSFHGQRAGLLFPQFCLPYVFQSTHL